MKTKIFKNLLNLAVVSTPIVAMPLVNATLTTNNEWEAIFTFGKKGLCNYTVWVGYDSAHSEWGQFAKITKMFVSPDDTVESVAIPGTVEIPQTPGVQYKVRQIATSGNATGSGTIQELDLSQAVWLDEICRGSFSRSSDGNENRTKCGFRIKSVYWSGAMNLTKISDWAFDDQSFSSEAGRKQTLNFFYTGLKVIDSWSFGRCCEHDKRFFDKVIFPPTLEETSYDSFGGATKTDDAFRVTKIIFTDQTAKVRTTGSKPWPLFNPDTASTNQVIVPRGSLDAYKIALASDDDVMNHLTESDIIYNSEHEGSIKPCGLVGKSGVDELNKTWAPYDQTTGSYRYDCEPIIDNDYDGQLGLDDLGHLTWSNQLPVGQYTFRVYCYCYNQAKTKLSFAISDLITLTIASVDLSGGSLLLRGTSSKSGSDSGLWIPKVTSTPEKSITAIEYKLKDVPSELENKLSFDEEDKGCRIKWGSTIPKGIYHFNLQTKMLLEDTDTTITLDPKSITLIIEDDTDFNIALQYSIDSGTYQDYNGETINITNTQTIHFKATLGSPLSSEQTQPQLSIDGTGISEVTGSGLDWTFDFDASKEGNGKFNFILFATEKSSSESSVTQDVYSTSIDINVGDSQSFGGVPNDIYIDKSKQDLQYTIPIVTGEKLEILQVQTFKPTPWFSSSSRATSVQHTVSTDKKSLILTFPQSYFEYTDPYDVTDFVFKIWIQNTETNDTWNYNKSFSVISTNVASVEYKGSQFIDVQPNSEYKHQEPIKYLLNGEEIAKDENIKFTLAVNSKNPELYDDHINILTSSNNNSAILSFSNLPYNDETKDGLSITVKITDATNMAVTTIDMTIYAVNNVEIVDVPGTISTYQGQSGKSFEKIYTRLNGGVAHDATYKINGISSPGLIEVDEDGYISWNNQIPVGEYTLTIESTCSYEELKSYKDFKFIVKANPAVPKDNRTAIIAGSSVGAGVGASGASTGIVVGVNKYKSKGKRK